jgi:sulfate/thiosulfate transport system substrate-binding protein
MWRNKLSIGIVLLVAGMFSPGLGCGPGEPQVEILNVSYDPTRELYRKLNRAFIQEHEQETGVTVRVRQSHGGSGSQARSVLDGIPADVVTLALWSDTNAIAKKGLIAKDWDSRFDNQSLPYFSTVVFVVRKGNPKGIHDWPDLLQPNVQIISPNPKTSGGAKLNLLAAWGAALRRNGITDTSTPVERQQAEEAAKKFVSEMFRNCPVLDSGARGATITFARRMIGDVHLTWENEALLEKQELGDELEIVYPSCSIKAEPHVAVVDQNVDRKGTREVAEAYMRFLYTEKGQEIIAENWYRPTNPRIAEKFADRFPNMPLFRIDYVEKGGWDAAQKRFFADGGLFDQIYAGGQE